MKTLTIRLTAPLQSYGNQATFNQRTSDNYPSKSAVLGMVAAALGIRRCETSKLQRLNNLKFAARIEQFGQMFTEFQTVEYKKSASKFDRKLVYRDFLQDAVFMVAIGGSDEEIENINYALHHPKFALFLGRRSNPPAGPLKTEIIDNSNPALVLKELNWKASEWYKKKYRSESYRTSLYADIDLIDGRNILVARDKIGSLDLRNRYYEYRRVVRQDVILTNPYYQKEDDYFSIVSEGE